MKIQEKISFLILRVGMGCYMFYAGITKVIDPTWSAEGYIKSAHSFIWFYEQFLNPAVLPVVNFLNAWGLTLLGISLVCGLLVRWSTIPGIVLMLLYYGAALDFPYPDAHSFIIDQHLIYSSALLLLYVFRVGEVWGLDYFIYRKKVN